MGHTLQIPVVDTSMHCIIASLHAFITLSIASLHAYIAFIHTHNMWVMMACVCVCMDFEVWWLVRIFSIYLWLILMTGICGFFIYLLCGCGICCVVEYMRILWGML